jgi:hypothetical protein
MRSELDLQLAVLPLLMRHLRWFLIGVTFFVVPDALAQIFPCTGPPLPGPNAFWIYFNPSAPNSANPFAITVGGGSYIPVGTPPQVQVQGNIINVTFAANFTFLSPPPQPTCGGAFAGPRTPGVYTVNLYILDLNLAGPVPFLAGTTSLVVSAAPARTPEYAVVPANPKNLELIVLQVRSSGCIASQSLRFVSGTIQFDIRDSDTCFSTPPAFYADVALGRFPAGTYPLAVYRGPLNPLNGTPFLDYSAQVVVTERVTQRSMLGNPNPPPPSIDVSDHWWNPQESGWGMSIMQHPSDRLFAVWFVYNASNQPVWYTLQPGGWTSAWTYTGPIYKTTGPYYGGPFDPAQVGITQVGTGTLTFTDYTTGTFAYTVEGVSGSKSITRLPF